MKGILIVLLILIQTQVASDIILKKELIGTWKIEKVQVTRTGVCLQNDFREMIGTTFKFKEEQQLLVISNNDWFQLPNEEEIRWYLEDEHLIIKLKNTQEVYRSKISFEECKLILLLSNLTAIHLIRISKK
ncbi:hypothetical protein SAMN04488007_0776 [Maribacter aquivivus]|uniref:Lipocalin-like domain-containing protein n=1 Tax=Maribacter aquivivus TaxID=228958 RepID=A0A1M6KG96_9FLAO|nr:hypothetical protein [Maribacter aquivivus]SHJ57975.1 hypothetical protein SAMN04488007_0776 [Maribacter aquivivus]